MYSFSYVLATLALIIPKKKNLVLFGAFNGNFFGDNAAFLFRHMLKEHRDLHIVWLTNSPEVIQQVRKLGAEAYRRRSLRGIWLTLIAPIYLTTHSVKDVLMYIPFRKRPKHVYLHHGIPLIKGWLDRKEAPKKAVRSTYEKIRATNYMIAPSHFAATQQNHLIPIGLDHFKITGLPRNDTFFDPSFQPETQKEKFGLTGFQKIILYAPTWRPWGATQFFPFPDVDLPTIHRFLAERRLVMILRPHHVDLNSRENQSFWEQVKELPHFRIIDHRLCPDVNILCRLSDALITDYSSLYYDYLLCDRPVIFLDYDFERYNREIGFYCNYREIAIGAKPKTQEAFSQVLADVTEGIDPLRERRQAFKNQFYEIADGHSSERVVQLIRSLIQ